MASRCRHLGGDAARLPLKLAYKYRYRNGGVTVAPSGEWLTLNATGSTFVRQEEKYQDLTRIAIQAKGPDGKWTRKPLAYRESNNVHLLITRPPDICVNLVFKHIHAASSYTICRQFVPFIYCSLSERVLPDVQSTLILY